jgi:hypothetical protein
VVVGIVSVGSVDRVESSSVAVLVGSRNDRGSRPVAAGPCYRDAAAEWSTRCYGRRVERIAHAAESVRTVTSTDCRLPDKRTSSRSVSQTVEDRARELS